MAITFVAASSQYLAAAAELAALRATASLSFWLRTTQVGDDTIWLAPGVTGVEQAGGDNDFFWGCLDNNGGASRMRSGRGNGSYYGTGQVNTGAEFHIVFTYNKSNGLINVYVDSVLITSGTTGTADVTTTFSRIASVEDTGGTPTYLDGTLDDVRIYNRVLSAAEVSILYAQRGGDDIREGLVSQYRMSEGAPGVAATGAATVIDETGANHCTPTASPTYAESMIVRRRAA